MAEVVNTNFAEIHSHVSTADVGEVMKGRKIPCVC